MLVLPCGGVLAGNDDEATAGLVSGWRSKGACGAWLLDDTWLALVSCGADSTLVHRISPRCDAPAPGPMAAAKILLATPRSVARECPDVILVSYITFIGRSYKRGR